MSSARRYRRRKDKTVPEHESYVTLGPPREGQIFWEGQIWYPSNPQDGSLCIIKNDLAKFYYELKC